MKQAAKLLEKYILPVRMGDATFYAYRHLENNVPETVISAEAGEDIDMSKTLGRLGKVKVTGGCLERKAEKPDDMRIKPGTPAGVHTLTVALDDGTAFSVKVEVRSK